MSTVPTISLEGEALIGCRNDLLPPRAFLPAGPVSVRLGRKRVAARKPAPRLAAYLDHRRAAAAVPEAVDYAAKAAASLNRTYLNDRFGDCVVAGKYHAAGVWTANDGPAAAVATDREVYETYQRVCGPGDNGCVITDVLDHFRDRGLPFNGVTHTIDGYVSLDWTNGLEVQVALYLFGALAVGINLPEAWTRAAVWDVTDSPVVGGHDVTAVGYDATGVYVSSWGRVYRMTWPAFRSTRFVEELYAMLSPDWYGSDRLAPCGLDAATLKADLAKIGGGAIPDVNPTPTPPPSPSPVPPMNPTYDVSLHGWFGSMTGTAVPRSSHAALAVAPDWPALIRDALAIAAAVVSKDYAAVLPVVQQLVADLHLFGERAAVRYGLTPDQWAAIVQAVLAIVSALVRK